MIDQTGDLSASRAWFWALGFALLGASALLGGCDRSGEAAAAVETAVASPVEERDAEREIRAARLFTKATGSALNEKIAILSDLAHVYWDTDIAPQAFRDLVFYLVDPSNVQGPRALKELEGFVRRRPDDALLVLTASLFFYGINKELERNPTGPAAADLEKLRARGLEIWLEQLDLFCEKPEHASDFRMHMSHGEALLMAERWADVERAWARVESFPEPARVFDRYTCFHRRGELHRVKLDDPKRALELYRKALELAPQLDPGTDERVIQFVRDMVKRLEDQG